MVLVTAVIIGLSLVNLVRMTWYLVGMDLYSIQRAQSRRHHRHRRGKAPALPLYRPTVSIVVPAHNEGATIERTLACLLAMDYSPLQIIVVDDGSTDDTCERIYNFKRKHDPLGRIEAFTQPNGGKADALNTAIRTRATGELIMCLDGDSLIAPDAVTNSVARFDDPRVVATASNTSIAPNGTLLGLVQRFEYMICHQMKKAHSAFNVEYIIGGIGSMFRRSLLEEVGLYDTNTMTEDIDLSMKILSRGGNKNQRFQFVHDSIAYTAAVLSFRDLVRQRYRWKYGRLQTFLKNWRMFFSMDRKLTFGLSWIFLPYALWQELIYLIEPLVVGVIVFTAIYYNSPATLLWAVTIISSYIVVNVVKTTHFSLREKLALAALAPAMYVFFYLLSIVEYLALLQSLVKLPGLRRSLREDRVTWKSPERRAVQEALA